MSTYLSCPYCGDYTNYRIYGSEIYRYTYDCGNCGYIVKIHSKGEEFRILRIKGTTKIKLTMWEK